MKRYWRNKLEKRNWTNELEKRNWTNVILVGAANMRCIVQEDRSKLMVVTRKRRIVIGHGNDSIRNLTFACPTLKLPGVAKGTRNEFPPSPVLSQRPSRFVPSYSSGYVIESPMVSRIPLQDKIPTVEQQLTSIVKRSQSCDVIASEDDGKRVRFQPIVVVHYFDNAGPICARRGLLRKDSIPRGLLRSSCVRHCRSVKKSSRLVVSGHKRACVPPVLSG